MNNFGKQLAFSNSFEDHPIWTNVYKSFFPGLVSIISHKQDGEHQRAGIDRSIVLSNSKQILIDEKVRGRNAITGLVYDDIALEFLSNDNTGALGWVCKPLRCDYIAYLIAPLGKCYLLPVLQLQLAYDANKAGWHKIYRVISARNATYNTKSLVVPVDVLFAKIGACLRSNFEPFEI